MTSHTGETGATWSDNNSAGGSARVVAATDRCRHNSGTSRHHASGTPAGVEYDVQADLTMVSQTGSASILGRLTTSGNVDYYQGDYSYATSKYELAKVVNGTRTVLASTSASTVPAGETHTIRLEIKDATKKLFLDSVETLSSADNVITAAGVAGLVFSGGGSDSNGIHIDNFSASDSAAAVEDSTRRRLLMGAGV